MTYFAYLDEFGHVGSYVSRTDPTNNISGTWCGSYFANSEKWNALPAHLQELFRLCMDSSHYYRQYWYWGGEADLRVNGTKLKLTSIPDEEWATVEAEAVKFWDEIAAQTPRTAKEGRHPAGVQRGDGQGGTAVSLHLRARRGKARARPRPSPAVKSTSGPRAHTAITVRISLRNTPEYFEPTSLLTR